jgi:hypothetical protein
MSSCLEKTHYKKGLVGWLKVWALSSNSSPGKKKKTHAKSGHQGLTPVISAAWEKLEGSQLKASPGEELGRLHFHKQKLAVVTGACHPSHILL